MFIDVAKIHIKAGKGGDGAVSFHREKYVNAGGPDGGDGGKGGNVVFVADQHLNTLMDFRYKRKYSAMPGENGSGNNCTGRSAEDLLIKVPKGTLIKEAESGRLMKDMSDDKPFVAAKGGNGGWGNQHFATPTRQIPRFAKPGQEGEEFDIRLELKLIADVGLLGFPNVGKSTFLSRVSKARPKIANYHFTTLTPNLGVVEMFENKSFVLADIPGIIEGASEGVGLGHAFLRHVERCRLLLHVVDLSGSEGRDPIVDFNTINDELAKYSEVLSGRSQIVVGNKSDSIFDEEKASEFEAYIKSKGYKFFRISAVSGEGIKELIAETVRQLDELPETIVFEPDFVPEAPVEEKGHQFTVEKVDGVYRVEGEFIRKIMAGINFSDGESIAYFEKVLRSNGVMDELEERGIQEGDTVEIYDFGFEYVR